MKYGIYSFRVSLFHTVPSEKTYQHILQGFSRPWWYLNWFMLPSFGKAPMRVGQCLLVTQTIPEQLRNSPLGPHGKAVDSAEGRFIQVPGEDCTQGTVTHLSSV